MAIYVSLDEFIACVPTKKISIDHNVSKKAVCSEPLA
jgi:hypothetical protein